MLFDRLLTIKARAVRASAFQETGNITRALAELEALISSDETNSDLYLRRADAQLENGSFELAAKDYQTAAELDASLRSLIRLRRGVALTMAGDLPDAGLYFVCTCARRDVRPCTRLGY